ncbi:hypothetical protein ABTF68_21260, partial [Acinetobacter baumannii]
ENCIEDDGAQALAEMLSQNTSLQTLNLHANGVDDKTLQTIENELNLNPICQNLLDQKRKEIKTTTLIRSLCPELPLSQLPNELLFEV